MGLLQLKPDFQQPNISNYKPEVNKNLQQFKSNFQQQKKEVKKHNVARNTPKFNENLHNFKDQFQQKQQQQKLLTRRAKQWLENLDEYSDEGLWFESFSRSYPSRLEAAMEYLAVLNASS